MFDEVLGVLSTIKLEEVTAINKDTAYDILNKDGRFLNKIKLDNCSDLINIGHRVINREDLSGRLRPDTINSLLGNRDVYQEYEKEIFDEIWKYITKIMGNEKYNYNILQWYVGTKKNPFSIRYLEDVGRVKDALDRKDRFKALINSDPFLRKYRDLNQITFTQLEELNDILKSKQTASEEKAGYEESLVKSKQAEILLNNDEWKVVIPKSEEAAKYYGRNTRWCTSSENNNMYLRYAEEGDLIIIIHKKDNQKFQLHFEANQYMNSKDEDINKEELELIKPVVLNLLPKFNNVSVKAKLMFNEESMSEEEKLEVVKKEGFNIQYIKNPSEKIQLEAVRQFGDNIQYNIQYIENPTEKVQLKAVKQDSFSIQYIKNPSEKVQLEAVKQNAFSVRHIESPSEAVQLEAVKQDSFSIKYIKNPCKVVLDYVNNDYKESKANLIESATPRKDYKFAPKSSTLKEQRKKRKKKQSGVNSGTSSSSRDPVKQEIQKTLLSKASSLGFSFSQSPMSRAAFTAHVVKINMAFDKPRTEDETKELHGKIKEATDEVLKKLPEGTSKAINKEVDELNKAKKDNSNITYKDLVHKNPNFGTLGIVAGVIVGAAVLGSIALLNPGLAVYVGLKVVDNVATSENAGRVIDYFIHKSKDDRDETDDEPTSRQVKDDEDYSGGYKGKELEDYKDTVKFVSDNNGVVDKEELKKVLKFNGEKIDKHIRSMEDSGILSKEGEDSSGKKTPRKLKVEFDDAFPGQREEDDRNQDEQSEIADKLGDKAPEQIELARKTLESVAKEALKSENQPQNSGDNAVKSSDSDTTKKMKQLASTPAPGKSKSDIQLHWGNVVEEAQKVLNDSKATDEEKEAAKVAKVIGVTNAKNGGNNLTPPDRTSNKPASDTTEETKKDDEEDDSDSADYEKSIEQVTKSGVVDEKELKKELGLDDDKLKDHLDSMQEEGIISKPNKSGKRKVLMTYDEAFADDVSDEENDGEEENNYEPDGEPEPPKPSKKKSKVQSSLEEILSSLEVGWNTGFEEITAINKDTAYNIIKNNNANLGLHTAKNFIEAIKLLYNQINDMVLFKIINDKMIQKNNMNNNSKKALDSFFINNEKEIYDNIWDYITKVMGNEKYNYNILQWYLGTKKNPRSLQRLEDVGRVKDALDRKERFKALINSDPTLHKYRDLNQITFKDLEDLNDILKSKQSGKEEKAGVEDDLIKSKQAEVLLNNDEWKVVIPKSEEAAKYYGKNTRWCTSADKNNMYLYYAEQGDLIVLIHKKDNNKFQLHFETDQFMNSKDEYMNQEEIGLIKPVVKNLLPKFKNVSLSGRLTFDEENITEEEKLEVVKQYGLNIKYIQNPSEKVQLEAIKQDGYSIKYIKNPSEKLQLEAVKRDGYSIEYIENTSEKVQLEAVKQNGFSIDYIQNPSEKVQLEAVKQNSSSIEYINNPSEAVKNYVKNYNQKSNQILSLLNFRSKKPAFDDGNGLKDVDKLANTYAPPINEPTYAAFRVNPVTAKRLKDWFEKRNIRNVMPDTNKLHVTVCYSKAPISYKPLKLLLDLIKAEPLSIEFLGRESDKQYIVLKVESPLLRERFNYAMSIGASYDFPEYIPHISISEPGHNHIQDDLNKLDINDIDFPILLDYEFAEPLKTNAEASLIETISSWSSKSVKEQGVFNILASLVTK